MTRTRPRRRTRCTDPRGRGTSVRGRALGLALGLALLVTAAACGGSQGAARDDEPAATTTTEPPGPPYEIATLERVYRNGDRVLPTVVRHPTEGEGPFPLIVFGHGLNGHPRKFAELLTTWAEAGYVVAAPRFPFTSDDTTGASAFLGDVVNQPGDLEAVIDGVLDDAEGDGTAAAVVDPERIGAAGLSLGGVTVYGLAFDRCCTDDRLDAAIVLAGALLPIFGDYDFRPLPLMIVHGDADPVFRVGEAEEAYARAAAPKWLVTLAGGGHSPPFEDPPDPADAAVREITTRFWDAYLRDGGDDADSLDALAAAADEPPATTLAEPR